MSDNNKKINDLIKIRINKLNNFVSAGIDPFPHNFDLNDTVETIIENEKKTIVLNNSNQTSKLNDNFLGNING